MTELDRAREVINKIDKEMAILFQKRMDAVFKIAQYKKENSLPVENTDREQHVIDKNTDYITEDKYKPYYIEFIKNTMNVSKKFQKELLK